MFRNHDFFIFFIFYIILEHFFVLMRDFVILQGKYMVWAAFLDNARLKPYQKYRKSLKENPDFGNKKLS